MTAFDLDPMQRVWDAAEAAGCNPIGQEHKFVARCPAHDDRRPSLAVTEGADRRVLLHCRSGCAAESVVAALGLRMSDLFPVGHEKGLRPPPAVRRSPKPAEALLMALDKVGAEWSGLVSTRCPYCDHEAVWWRITPEGVSVDCPEGCTRAEVLRALETHLELAEQGEHLYPRRAA